MKRFTETVKWDDPWFAELSLPFKVAWLYICDRCDLAGVWNVNMGLLNYQCGTEINLEQLLATLGDERAVRVAPDKIWLPKFISFQYGSLTADCKPHRPVIKRLESLGLLQRVSEGYRKGIDTLQEKEKEKEKEKDKEEEGSGEEIPLLPTDPPRPKSVGPCEQAKQIYSAYRKKVDKTCALKAIERALQSYSFDFLLEKTKTYGNAFGSDLTYMCKPSTFFNGERFNDDPANWTRDDSNKTDIRNYNRAAAERNAAMGISRNDAEVRQRDIAALTRAEQERRWAKRAAPSPS
jgi:hypothetical protein